MISNINNMFQTYQNILEWITKYYRYLQVSIEKNIVLQFIAIYANQYFIAINCFIAISIGQTSGHCNIYWADVWSLQYLLDGSRDIAISIAKTIFIAISIAKTIIIAISIAKTIIIAINIGETIPYFFFLI